MNEHELQNELEDLMTDVVTDAQTIYNGGSIVTLQDNGTVTKFGSSLGIDMAKKSARIAEILQYFEFKYERYPFI